MPRYLIDCIGRCALLRRELQLKLCPLVVRQNASDAPSSDVKIAEREDRHAAAWAIAPARALAHTERGAGLSLRPSHTLRQPRQLHLGLGNLVTLEAHEASPRPRRFSFFRMSRSSARIQCSCAAGRVSPAFLYQPALALGPLRLCVSDPEAERLLRAIRRGLADVQANARRPNPDRDRRTGPPARRPVNSGALYVDHPMNTIVFFAPSERGSGSRHQPGRSRASRGLARHDR